MKEQILLKKIRKGDAHALDTYIRELYPHVYAFAYRRMQGDDVAKDITQEVFIRFIRQLPLYHYEGKTLHYLYRITSNICCDHHRRRTHDSTQDIDDKLYALHDENDLHAFILTQIRNEELLYEIGQLSQYQQDVICLKYYHQMTFKEIAEAYDLPISTVKTRHAAALKKLAYLWKEGEHHAS